MVTGITTRLPTAVTNCTSVVGESKLHSLPPLPPYVFVTRGPGNRFRKETEATLGAQPSN
jgi:hypothetical protein